MKCEGIHVYSASHLFLQYNVFEKRRYIEWGYFGDSFWGAVHTTLEDLRCSLHFRVKAL